MSRASRDSTRNSRHAAKETRSNWNGKAIVMTSNDRDHLRHHNKPLPPLRTSQQLIVGPSIRPPCSGPKSITLSPSGKRARHRRRSSIAECVTYVSGTFRDLCLEPLAHAPAGWPFFVILQCVKGIRHDILVNRAGAAMGLCYMDCPQPLGQQAAPMCPLDPLRIALWHTCCLGMLPPLRNRFRYFGQDGSPLRRMSTGRTSLSLR